MPLLRPKRLETLYCFILLAIAAASFYDVAMSDEARNHNAYSPLHQGEISLSNLGEFSVYFVGIKGTGMAALAELFHKRGARVCGSDVPDRFYTDGVLRSLGIPYYEGFSKKNIPDDTKLVVYSAAYDPEEHPELVEAVDRQLPMIGYTEALALLSRNVFSVGISGVHGKTTTTALTAAVIKKLGLAGSVLVGSATADLGYQSALILGDEFFVAETCEYRRHFLSFSPDILVVTSIEEDHLDYYNDLADIKNAFYEYALKLPDDGILIYCADDPGAADLAARLRTARAGITLVPYGTSAEGAYSVPSFSTEPGRTVFTVKKFPDPFTVSIPGLHTVRNATAAIAVCTFLLERSRREINKETAALITEGIGGFAGSRRRSEIIGEAGGILFLDDYGHHPTAIQSTVEGLKQFYPDRRIVVDFMSHTYSRTAALFDGFAHSFSEADEVILHKIYSSAREEEQNMVSGRDLFEAVKQNHSRVSYFENVLEAEPYCRKSLRAGDLFITMGAGDNWILSHALYDAFAGSNERTEQRLQT